MKITNKGAVRVNTEVRKIDTEIQHKLNLIEAEHGKDSETYQMEHAILMNVQDILDVISEQGHTGLTINYLKQTLVTLIEGKTLSPLTGEESEWRTPRGGGDTTQQNIRCGAVFRKNGDNSTAYYINGKVFSDDNGQTWFTSKDSLVPVKFPCFVPETQYIILNGGEVE